MHLLLYNFLKNGIYLNKVIHMEPEINKHLSVTHYILLFLNNGRRKFSLIFHIKSDTKLQKSAEV